MKTCTLCHRLCADDARFCPEDGTALVPLDTPHSPATIPPDPNDPRLGSTLAQRYQLRRPIADGGTGRVYEAMDLRDGVPVAVKVMHSEVALDEVASRRFQQEFEVSSGLQHRHIVDVHDWLQLEGDNYAIVMDFLDGQDLRAVLQRHHVIHPARLIRILSQLAIALERAHRSGFVHRDLKPDNVFLCAGDGGDDVRLLDFGSVKAVKKGKSKAAWRLTAVGTTIGSPYYMSPEQAEGLESIDMRTDVWAVAVMCYEALTGRVPFQSPEPMRVLLAIVSQPHCKASVAAQQLCAQQSVRVTAIPDTVDAVIDEALAKDPEWRTASVSAFVDALGAAYGLRGNHTDWAYTRVNELTVLIDAYVEKWHQISLAKGKNVSDSSKGKCSGAAAPYDSVDSEWFAGAAATEPSKRRGRAMMWVFVAALGLLLVIVLVLVVIVFAGLFGMSL